MPMLARFLSLIATLLLATACTDARAYAPELKNPHLGFIELNLNPFQEKSPLSPSATKEKTLEIAAASIGRENYLRARYMDPAQGRFLGMDPWVGALADPLSAHRYLAVNLDPANRTDPSGLTSNLAELMSARDASTTLALSSVRTATINTARVAANDALWTATSAAAATSVAPNTSILTALALSIAANETHRFLGVPIIVFGGEEYPQHALHIAEAQVGFGSNYFPISPALNRVPAWSRDWLDYTSECENRNGFVCDEYPFASSRQGGLLNYLGFGVSLRLLNPSESWRTGFFIKDFYNDATISTDGLSPWSRFVALGIPGARSFYTDRKGNPHYTRYP